MTEITTPPKKECHQAETRSSSELLQALLESKASYVNKNDTISGVIIGYIFNIDNDGQLWVTHSGLEQPLAAKATCAATQQDVGRQCALMFENGNPSRPVVMGLLHEPTLTVAARSTGEPNNDSESIELSCGKSSLTLHANGHIELRGSKITSHSTGLNHIRGASVKLN